MTPKRGLLARHRAAILALAAQHGATDVRVFGSIARGEDDETSDVDLLVTRMPGDRDFALTELKSALKDLLGCEVDVVTDHPNLKPHFREELRREAIAV